MAGSVATSDSDSGSGGAVTPAPAAKAAGKAAAPSVAPEAASVHIDSGGAVTPEPAAKATGKAAAPSVAPEAASVHFVNYGSVVVEGSERSSLAVAPANAELVADLERVICGIANFTCQSGRGGAARSVSGSVPASAASEPRLPPAAAMAWSPPRCLSGGWLVQRKRATRQG